jgi:hypothetical protein
VTKDSIELHDDKHHKLYCCSSVLINANAIGVFVARTEGVDISIINDPRSHYQKRPLSKV